MVLIPTDRSLLALMVVCSSTVLTACEPMQPSGNPLAAVSVQPGVAGAGASSDVDTRFSDEEPFEMSSEDLSSKSSTSAGGGASTTKVGAAAAPAAASGGAASAPEPVSAPNPQPQPVAQTASQAAVQTAAVSAAATMDWPIRLVRTHLDEQPPSAILAMPDGRRIVVSPGDMVPERGLVVMAIGRERVQLAAIRSSGDHATVAPMELTAQY